MSDTNLDKVIDKIKKCLALSASSNEHEAAAALRQAQKLMAAYNVTQEALDGAEISIEKAKSLVCAEPPRWEIMLVDVVRRAFGCRASITRGWFDKENNRNGALASYSYLGLRGNAMTAAYAHDTLLRQIAKAKQEYVSGRYELVGRKERIAAGNAFAEGFLLAMEAKVEDLALDPKVSKMINERQAAYAPDTRVPLKKSAQDYDAYASGIQAGEKASLHRPVGTSAPRTAVGAV